MDGQGGTKPCGLRTYNSEAARQQSAAATRRKTSGETALTELGCAAGTDSAHLPREYSVWRVVRLRSGPDSLQGRGGDAKTCFLRNEANCNVRKTASIWLWRTSWIDYRKMTNGFVFFGWEERPTERRQSGTVAALTARGYNRKLVACATRPGTAVSNRGYNGQRTARCGLGEIPDNDDRDLPSNDGRPGAVSTSPAILRDPVVRRDSG